MKIMFLMAEGFDTPNSINHLVIALCEDILNAGHELYMVYSNKEGKYPDYPHQLVGHAHLTTTGVKRKQINKNNFVRRYLDEIKFAWNAMRKWKQNANDVDVAILQSNPCSFYHAVFMKLILKKPFILNLYDVFPGHAKSVGVMKSTLVFKILNLLQKALYGMCKRIVVMSSDMRDVLLHEGVRANKVVVVNNWYDDRKFRFIPRDENVFFSKYELNLSKFYVQFAGLLGYLFDY